jgi:AAHS family 4-hydroxybenzoate transporter-like MFS transporter
MGLEEERAALRAGAATGLTLDEALDAAPIGRTMIGAFLAAGLVMIIDGFDLSALPMTVPHVSRALGIAPAMFGPTLSAVLVGMGAGAILLAPIGDRRGRRPMILVNLALLGLVTLMTATATALWQFLLWRLLTGVALGACLPNVTALISEITPRRRRAGMLTITACGASIGGAGAGFLIPALIGLGGWHVPFLVSGIFTLGLVVLLFLTLPESPKFYAARHAAHPAYVTLARRLGLGDPALFALPENSSGKVPLLAPLAPQYRFATAVFCGLYTVNALALYMLSSWLPTLLPQAGFSLAQAARMAGMVQAGGLIGGILISFFLDRGKAMAGLMGAYAIVLVMLIGFSLIAPDIWIWGAMLLVVGSGIAGAHLALMAVGTSFYPASVLSAAIGIAVAVARLGAIAGPMLGAALIGHGASAQTFLLVMALPVLICGIGVILIPAAQRRRIG